MAGDVHRTLIDSGRIPDLFYDRNETACAWMKEREWWYMIDNGLLLDQRTATVGIRTLELDQAPSHPSVAPNSWRRRATPT